MTKLNMNRRTLLKSSAGAAIALAAPAIFTRPAFAADALTIGDTGGPYAEAFRLAFYDPFEAETGIRINNIVLSPDPVPQYQMLVDTSYYLMDVSVMTPEHIDRLNREGDYFEPLNLPNINPADFVGGAITDKFAAVYMFAISLGYRTDTLGENAPKSWADFWNTTAFPGRRSLYRSPITTMEIALLADGVAIDELYPLDIDRAFASLDKIKSEIAVWWTSGAQGTQLLQNGEVDMLNIWNTRAQTAINDGAPAAISWVEGHYNLGGWTIPKGSPKADMARKFIEYTLDPQRQAKYTEILAVSPTHLKGYDFVAEDKRGNLPTAPGHIEKLRPLDNAYWGENLNAVTERFEAWLLS
ncbi:putative spermidine/putrescine transport system substrate-binding protein [Devosia sp. YR412]|uniref:ABC transporter substrate-binding protein n=1 Tax=Devosia sp. YR412 TaxID=1881030 RepID=UPI0008D7FE30|nr:ABC transporter substrate-binding protein [Devosia sp. YR412]SEQ54034.1 putative spermidine/putrescine transport system substrate-binding protein [Devosia sp. YR412]